MGRQDSNLRMAESKSAALPLGDAPIGHDAFGDAGRTIPISASRPAGNRPNRSVLHGDFSFNSNAHASVTHDSPE